MSFRPFGSPSPLRRGSQSWTRSGVSADGLRLRIGIEAGYATIGRIGFEKRYDYGVLGPVANLASRLGAQAAAGQILVGQRLFAAVEEIVETAPAGNLELKGFARPVAAYEVRGVRLAPGRCVHQRRRSRFGTSEWFAEVAKLVRPRLRDRQVAAGARVGREVTAPANEEATSSNGP